MLSDPHPIPRSTVKFRLLIALVGVWDVQLFTIVIVYCQVDTSARSPSPVQSKRLLEENTSVNINPWGAIGVTEGVTVGVRDGVTDIPAVVEGVGVLLIDMEGVGVADGGGYAEQHILVLVAVEKLATTGLSSL